MNRQLIIAGLALCLVGCILLTGTGVADQPNDLESTLSGMEGDGTEVNPYVITNVEELQAMNADLDSHYVLGTDIDANETTYWNGGFDPIGEYSGTGTPFSGTFDGQGYEIRGLSINRPNQGTIGLFGHNTGTVQNVDLLNASIVGDGAVGGIAGRNYGIIDNTRNLDGDVEGNGNLVGGIVGSNDESGIVNRSTNTASVEGNGDTVGGVAGEIYGSSVVTESSNYGTVTAHGSYRAGGIAGILHEDSLIEKSYNRGNVSGGGQDVGGIAGAIGWASYGGEIRNSYSTGSVAGEQDVGGVVGDNAEGNVTDSYWDEEASGMSSSDGGTGLTTAEMTGADAKQNLGGFDFETTWKVSAEEYPEHTDDAEFVITSVEAPAETAQGQSWVATVTLENTGDFEGTKEVELNIEGEPQETREVTIGAKNSTTVEFSTSFETVGDYSYTVRSSGDIGSGSVTVVESNVTIGEWDIYNNYGTDSPMEVTETPFETTVESTTSFEISDVFIENLDEGSVDRVIWYVDGTEVHRTENISSSGGSEYTHTWENRDEYTVTVQAIHDDQGLDQLSWDVSVYDILISGQDSYAESTGGTFHVTQQFEVFESENPGINYTLEYNESILRIISGETSGTVDSGLTRTWEFQVIEPDYSGNALKITAEHEIFGSETKKIHLATRTSGGPVGSIGEDFTDSVVSNTWLEWLIGGFVDLGQSAYIQVQTVLTGGLLSVVWLHHFGTISLPVGSWTLKQIRTRTKVGLSAIIGVIGIGFVLPWVGLVTALTGLGWYFWDLISARFREVISPV